MISYVIVFWVSLIGHPDLVTKATIPWGNNGADVSESCHLFGVEAAQDWTDKHPAWELLTDDKHTPRCVEKREI